MCPFRSVIGTVSHIRRKELPRRFHLPSSRSYVRLLDRPFESTTVILVECIFCCPIASPLYPRIVTFISFVSTPCHLFRPLNISSPLQSYKIFCLLRFADRLPCSKLPRSLTSSLVPLLLETRPAGGSTAQRSVAAGISSLRGDCRTERLSSCGTKLERGLRNNRGLRAWFMTRTGQCSPWSGAPLAGEKPIERLRATEQNAERMFSRECAKAK
jgi:hypothetical protein